MYRDVVHSNVRSANSTNDLGRLANILPSAEPPRISRMRSARRRAGITLLELMVGLAIAGIVAALGIPAF